jgi:hypothetical protein
MSNYKISDYSYKKAKLVGVEIKPSSNPKKKIDVFKNGLRICSIGATGYNDYPSYLQNEGSEVANEHKTRYYQRHHKDISRLGTAGWYAWTLLW